jgi:putative MATE family efflux protein
MREGGSLSVRGGAAKRDWTKGSILGNLWSLSWPMLISNTINTLGPTVDMIWVGKLGSNDIAAVGVSGLTVQVANSLIFGLFTGTTAMIARFIGAKDEEQANKVAQQAFVIAAAFSILMAVIGGFLAEPILRLLGVADNVIAEGAAYMRIQFVGMVTMSALQVAQNIMQASGDTRTPLKISIGFRAFHLLLCPSLIFGWWLFPELGVRGAALSNVIAQGIGASIAIWLLFNGHTRLALTFKNFSFNRNLIWRTVKIGIPASITSTERNFAGLVLVSFITPFGTLAVAAHALSQRVDQIVQVMANGLGTPAGILAGQNMGAGQPERAEKTGWTAVVLSTCVAAVVCIFIWFFSEPILRIFTQDPELLAIGTSFLKIQIVTYMVWGSVIAMTQVLNGVGDTLIPMITNFITGWGIQMTLAYFLPGMAGLGIYGVRWAIVSGIAGRALIFPIYFKFGRWKHKKI